MIRISLHFDCHIHIHRNSRQEQPHRQPQPSSHPLGFFDRATAMIEELGNALSLSTRQNYMTALRSLRRYAGTELAMEDIDATLLHGYERWLQGMGVCRNTSSCYMRSLRSILGRVTHGQTDPLFQGIYTGRGKTEKRSVDRLTLNRLRQTKLPQKGKLALALDLFLFSYYAQGMPFVDMAFIRRSQIAEGRLTYERHKTGQRITISLLPCMQHIISRYQTTNSPYVFPLLHSTEPAQAYREYQTQLNWYNRSLKRLATLACISERLTSYTPRHSWATSAYHANMELPLISKALGHSNPHTTLTYLREIDDNRLEEANRKLLESL